MFTYLVLAAALGAALGAALDAALGAAGEGCDLIYQY